MFAIYSLTPAPWGDDYRFVEGFDTKDQAEVVLKALESVNIDFNLYKVVEHSLSRGGTDGAGEGIPELPY